jgi:hypothetical protein
MAEMGKEYNFFVGKPEKERPIRRSGDRIVG